MAAPIDPLTDFDLHALTFGDRTFDTYVAGSGPAIVVLTEIPGITPDVADCSRRLIEAGFTVYMPSLFGEPGRPLTNGYAMKSLGQACVSRQFKAFARGERAPVTDWLRALGEYAHAEAGGPGIGVIGMCFTGKFALALAIDDWVKVPILSQPATPMGPAASSRAALGIAPDDIAVVKRRTVEDELCVIGLRFTADLLVPAERFATLEREFGDAFIGVEIDSSKGNSWGFNAMTHSVLTAEWSADPEHPTAHAWKLVVDHLTERLL